MFPFKYKCQYCGNIQEEQDSPDKIIICNECGKVDIRLYSIDLFYIKPECIIKLLRADLKRRKEKRKPTVKLLWTGRTGKQVEISKCHDKHVENIIKMMIKLVPACLD